MAKLIADRIKDYITIRVKLYIVIFRIVIRDISWVKGFLAL